MFTKIGLKFQKEKTQWMNMECYLELLAISKETKTKNI
jgi:hypothetical protein